MTCPCGREVTPVVGSICTKCLRMVLSVDVVGGKIRVTWSDPGGMKG